MTTTRVRLLIAVVLSVFFQTTLQASLPSDTHYIAGVVEFTPQQEGKTSVENLENALQDYLKIIDSTRTLAEIPDILIFPESTLNDNEQATFVPKPADGVIPCIANEIAEYHNFLRLLSCAARNSSTYVVINLTEKELCLNATLDPRPCAANGQNNFNTNVVFDREGRVISKYRKMHLYDEPKNVTYLPNFGVFETDFGVRFGHFVCYDLLFYTPAQEMASQMGIKDFILTSMWFGQLPFLTAVQIQSSWAYANDVNLLAAGANNPATGTTGSGIYNGRKQPLVAIMNRRRGVRQLYVAKVPKYVGSKVTNRFGRQALIERHTIQPRLSQNDIIFKRDFLENYATELLNFTQGNQLQRRLCFKERFCCNFELSWRYYENMPFNPNKPYYRYRLGAFDDWRGESVNETNRLKNCAIFSCIGDDINDCGRLFPGETLMQPQVAFDRILIESTFPKASNYLLMPNSLRENLLPLHVDRFQWNVTERSNVQQVRFLMNTTLDDLLTFSIYANYYDNLVEGNGENAAYTVTNSVICITLFASLALILNNQYLS